MLEIFLMMYYIYTGTYAYIISVITVLSGTVYGLYVITSIMLLHTDLIVMNSFRCP